jgi:subfamily B ATP-binding cassette protein MsbA
MYAPIKRISAVYNQFFEAVAASERIFDMLGREPTIRSGSEKLEEPIESVEFDDVRLSYGETKALCGVSATVRRGELLALVGDSGGGKSSLVNLVPRLFDPDSGRVLVNGIDSRELDLVSLRQRIGLVTQRVFIFHDTVAANVAYGLEIDPERVETALKRAGAWDFVSQMDGGIDSLLEEFGANLSGGQRQRLAIARALYRQPDILILDEATSALDNRSEAAIQKALEDVTPTCITFVIAHRLSTIELADRVLLLRGGRIEAEGTLAELKRSSREFQRLAEGELPA